MRAAPANPRDRNDRGQYRSRPTALLPIAAPPPPLAPASPQHPPQPAAACSLDASRANPHTKHVDAALRNTEGNRPPAIRVRRPSRAVHSELHRTRTRTPRRRPTSTRRRSCWQRRNRRHSDHGGNPDRYEPVPSSDHSDHHHSSTEQPAIHGGRSRSTDTRRSCRIERTWRSSSCRLRGRLARRRRRRRVNGNL
jgi:hypothetical protein